MLHAMVLKQCALKHILVLWSIGLLIAGSLPREAFAQSVALEQTMFAPFPNPAFPQPLSVATSTSAKTESSGIALLSVQDRQRYQRIFALQQQAQWDAAQAIIKTLDNRLLMGYVNFQRLMHPTGWRSSFDELAEWLDRYADHAGAERIYRLARKRRPAVSTRRLIAPQALPAIAGQIQPEVKTEPAKKPRQSAQVLRIRAQVKRNIANGVVSATWDRLRTREWRQYLSDEDYIQALGDLAKGYVIFQRDAKAIAVADEALVLLPSFPSQAYWWAGLAAWRLGNHKVAADFFVFLGNHPEASPDLAAASSFWAWRALLHLERAVEAHQALLQAARDGYSFYGQLARHALGIAPEFDWDSGQDIVVARQVIAQYPVLLRILALSEIGQFSLAKSEANRLVFGNDLPSIKAMSVVADRAGLANFAIKVGRRERKISGEQSDITRYPLPRWQYQENYVIDRALLYALIRQESLFSTSVTSRAGAGGLMQLMPGTARMMERRLSLSPSDTYDPKHNLLLGQEYLRHLLTLPEINYNLIYTLAGYNAGPGRLNDWLRSVPNADDPLLFLETIPVRETREYIEKVLANFWIYRQRLQQETPSMTAMLEGNWPLYRRFDNQPRGSS